MRPRTPTRSMVVTMSEKGYALFIILWGLIAIATYARLR